MAIGPVEYIIVGFPGNQFNGEIAPELGKLVDSGTIRVLDLVFVTKDADGNVGAVEFEGTARRHSQRDAASTSRPSISKGALHRAAKMPGVT